MKKDVREFYLSADELAWETVAKVREVFDNYYVVLYLSRNESGKYYYGVIEAFCDDYSVMESKENVIRFFEECPNEGFSAGEFDTIAEVNEDIFCDSHQVTDDFGRFQEDIFDRHKK